MLSPAWIHVIRSGALRTAGTCASDSDEEYERLCTPALRRSASVPTEEHMEQAGG